MHENMKLPLCIRARLVGRGFTVCGEMQTELQEASGHDFSRADQDLIKRWVLTPEGGIVLEGGEGFNPRINPSTSF
jgi:hypothetical protein